MEIVTKPVKHYFTPEEKEEIAVEMSSTSRRQDELEREKKAVMSSYKDKIDNVILENRIAAQKYHDGYEYRNVECEVVRDYEMEEVRYVRTDTGEVVEARRMEKSELQMRLEDARAASVQ